MHGQAINTASLAGKLLAAVEEHFAGTDNPLPDRRGVVPGESRTIAWDCEQLTVSLDGIGWGQAIDATPTSPQAGGPASVSALRHAVFSIQLVRCTPTRRDGKTPEMDQLNAAGMVFMRDAGMLSQAVVEFVTQLRQGLDPTVRVQAGVIEAIGPSGGYHGLACALIVTASRLE